MAQSLLGLKTRGSGFPQLFQVIGATPLVLGNTFGTMLYTPGAGTFLAGDTITNGAQSALVTQVLTSPNRLILNSMNGSFIGTSGTFTATVGSGATGTATAFEGREGDGSADTRRSHARVIQFQNRVYAYHYWTVYRLNEATGNVEEVYRNAQVSTASVGADSIRKTGLFNLAINGIPNLVALYTYTGGGSVLFTQRLKSPDGVTWSELQIASGGTPALAADGSATACVWNNVVYMYSTSFTGTSSWDPSTDGFSQQPLAQLNNNGVKLIVWQNRLFSFQITGVPSHLDELIAGVWTFSNTGPTGSPQWTIPGHSCFGFVSPSSGALVMIHRDTFTNTLRANKFTMIAGVVQVGTDLPAVLPAAFSVANTWCVDGYVDQEANALAGGPPVVFLWTSVDDTAGTTRTYWEYVDDATALTNSQAGCPVEIALPNLAGQCGGGDRSFFSGELDVDIVAAEIPATGGERISFKIFQKTGQSPVSGVKLKIAYGTKGEVPMVAFATLFNPSVGTLNGSHEVDGLTADGTTVYQVTWKAVSVDGVSNFSNVERALLVYT